MSIDRDAVCINRDALKIDRNTIVFTVRLSKIEENQIITHPMEYNDACQHAPITHRPSVVYCHAEF